MKKGSVGVYDDYIQSANTLFNFMKEKDYLESILSKRAIIPRYCEEDISYLGLHIDDKPVNKIAVLQKCFCDIPFHKIMDNFKVNGVGEVYEHLTEEEKLSLAKNNNHPAFYGQYGIGFSKRWGENNKLQPVHYLNMTSQYTKEFSNLVNNILSSEDVQDEYVNDILNRLSFIKPLRGIMKRAFKRDDLSNINIELYKNFHDEQEWRYVPESKKLDFLKIGRIIVKPRILDSHGGIREINNNMESERYKELWIDYSYDEIKYIIVPDIQSRVEIINTIMNIPEKQFTEEADVNIQKCVLISKILVLDEIRKDW